MVFDYSFSCFVSGLQDPVPEAAAGWDIAVFAVRDIADFAAWDIAGSAVRDIAGSAAVPGIDLRDRYMPERKHLRSFCFCDDGV